MINSYSNTDQEKSKGNSEKINRSESYNQPYKWSYNSDRLIATNRSNPCPICSKTNGNCRTKGELVLCMTNTSSYKEEFRDIGYDYIGDTKDGLWGMFAPCGADSDYYEGRKRKYGEYRLAEEEAQRERHKGSLSIEERDQYIRLISKTIGITSKHKQHLLDRGLTEEQIKEGYYFSIKPFTKIPKQVSSRLAGTFIDREGDDVIGSDFAQGIGCPAFNKHGLITGYQIRRESKENKYIWAKTGSGNNGTKKIIQSHLQNGELPLTYHGNGRKRLYMLEGILKPDIAHHLHDIDTVGANGGNYWSCKEQLKEIIADYEEIVLIPDAGDVLNRQVLKRIAKTYKLLQSLGKELKIGWYGQITKDKGDIDEIEELDYQLLSFENFQELTKKIQYNIKKKGDLKQFTEFTPNITMNTRYVADELNKIEVKDLIIAIKAAKNTGKSYWLKSLVEELRRRGEKIILIGNRRILTTELCNQLNITFINLNDDEDDAFLAYEKYDTAGLVVDSSLKLRHIDWEGATLIIDEAEQFLDSLLLSKTHIKNVRGKVMALYAKKFPQLKNIILLDADLSNLTCNYFAKVANKEVLKIKNTFIENKRELFLLDNQEQYINYIDIKRKNNETIFVLSDSSTELTALHEAYKDQYKCILLTQESLADDHTLWDYINNNGRKIKQNNIQIVFSSPVIQSGLSLEIYKDLNQIADNGYFDSVLGIFYGVVPPNIARQMLIRDRSNAKRILWCAERGVYYENNFDWEDIKKQKEFRNTTLLELLEYQEYLHEGDLESNMQQVIKLIKGNEIKDYNQEFRAKLLAKRNIQLSDYKQILIDELAEEGYKIRDENILEEEAEVKPSFDIDEIKEHLIEEKATQQFNAKNITEGQAKIYERKDSLKPNERAELLKYRLMQMLPNFPLSIEFIALYSLKNRRQIIQSIQRLVLCEKAEVAKVLDKQKINYQLEQAMESGFLWLDDIKDYSIIVNIYQKLSLKEIINDPDLIIDKEFLQNFEKNCRKVRNSLKLFNIKWNKKSYKTKLMKKVLALFGLTIKQISNSNGNRKFKIFKVGLMKDLQKDVQVWDNIYSSLNDKYSGTFEINNPLKSANLEKKAENIDIYKSESNPEPSEYYISSTDSVSKLKPEPVRVEPYFSHPTSKNEVQAEEVTAEKVNLEGEQKDDFKLVKFQEKLYLFIEDLGNTLLIKNHNTHDLIEVNKEDAKIIERGTKCSYLDKLNNWIEGVIYQIADYGVQCMSTTKDMLWCALYQVQLNI